MLGMVVHMWSKAQVKNLTKENLEELIDDINDNVWKEYISAYEYYYDIRFS